MPEQPPVYEGDDYSVVGGDPSFDTDSFDTGEPAISEWEDSADETDGTLDSDSDDRVIDDTAVAKNSLEPFIARHKNKRQIKKDQKLMKKVFGEDSKYRIDQPITDDQRRLLIRMDRASSRMEKMDRKLALTCEIGGAALGEMIDKAPGTPKFLERRRARQSRKAGIKARRAQADLAYAEKMASTSSYWAKNVKKAKKELDKANEKFRKTILSQEKQDEFADERDRAIDIINDSYHGFVEIDNISRTEDAPENDDPVAETGRELPFRVIKPISVDSDEDGAPRVEIPKVKLPDEAEAGNGSDKPEEETSTEEDVRAKSEAEKINEQDLKKGDIITTDRFGEESEWTVHSYNESTGKILITRPANDGSGTRVGEYVTIDQITGRKSKASNPKAKNKPVESDGSYEKLLDKFPNA